MQANNSYMNKLFKGNYLYLLILGIAFILSYNFIYDNKIDTNGDNAGYYILAKSIATGKGYSNIHRPDEPAANHLPPGYPVIISSVFKVFGTKISTVKIANGVLFFISLCVLFLIFKILTRNKLLAFAATLALLFNAHLLRFSTLMMSEIPFLLFSSLSILVYLKMDKGISPLKNSKLLLLILLLACTFYIRTTGIALIAGICLALVLEKRYKHLAATVAGIFILILPWQIRGQLLGGNSYLHQLIQKNPYRPEMGIMNMEDWLTRLLTNTQRYIVHEIPASCFPSKVINYQAETFLTDWIPGILICLLLIYGILKIKEHRSLLVGYIAGSFGILLLWPEVWYGVRFILPLVPILILIVFVALQSIVNSFVKVEKIQYVSPLILTAIMLWITYPQIKFNNHLAKISYPMNYNNYLFLAKWAKTNTPDSAIICCRKDQLFYLFSNRKTVRYESSLVQEEVINEMRSDKVTHVVLDQLGFNSTIRYLYPAVKRYPNKFKTINHQNSPDTYLFEFKPELGYWGQWKDDKREGEGTFVYDNNEKYVGSWKNDIRNGRGKYHLNNGNILEGVWRNDSLVQQISISN